MPPVTTALLKRTGCTGFTGCETPVQGRPSAPSVNSCSIPVLSQPCTDGILTREPELTEKHFDSLRWVPPTQPCILSILFILSDAARFRPQKQRCLGWPGITFSRECLHAPQAPTASGSASASISADQRFRVSCCSPPPPLSPVKISGCHLSTFQNSPLVRGLWSFSFILHYLQRFCYSFAAFSCSNVFILHSAFLVTVLLRFCNALCNG